MLRYEDQPLHWAQATARFGNCERRTLHRQGARIQCGIGAVAPEEVVGESG